MSTKRTKPPSYRLHKASGNAVVTLSGQDVYLGPHGTKVSKAEYDRVVGEWMANGRTLAKRTNDAPGVKVIQLVTAFRKANVYPASQSAAHAAVIKLVARLYGRTPAAEFGPIALKVVRSAPWFTPGGNAGRSISACTTCAAYSSEPWNTKCSRRSSWSRYAPSTP